MKSTDINLLFETVFDEQHHIDEFNRRVTTLDEKKRKKCIIRPTDSANKIRRKCKRAKVWGVHYAPVWNYYMTHNTPEPTQPSTDTSTPSADAGDAGGDAGGAVMEESVLLANSTEENLKLIGYTFPNTEYEWNEAKRYSEFANGGKEKWNELVSNGQIARWSELGDVLNFDADLENLNPNKINNVRSLIKFGQVELPIVGRWSDGQYELISGNTRVALLSRLGYDPYVLVIDIPTQKQKRKKPTTKKTPTKKKPTPKKPKTKEKPKSSTERVRRYYKRHPEKVRKYLRNTQDDRVKRNGDRAKAVKKYGEKKMKNHDVHHPNGVNGGKWRLAKKDHGRDKKNESIVEYIYLSELIEGNAPNGPWVLLSEGGAAGHLAHPYEDNDLTFKDVKEMIKRGLVGGLDAEAPVTEKLDGQNIMFTVRDGRVVFARNKGQVKNRGQNALDVAGIRSMFAGRGNIERAFTQSATDLQSAVDALPAEERKQMFGDGRKFMNVEIIFPDTKNVIPYDKSVLVFHGTVEYDDEGEEVGREINDGKKLSDQLTKVNAQQQSTFGLSGPRSISFSDAETAQNMKKMKEYGSDIKRLQDEFGLDDKSTLEDYKKAWWSREIDSMGLDWSPQEREGLIRRWALGDKSFGVKNIENPDLKKVFREFEAKELSRMQKIATRPLERVFLRLGADTLKRVTNFLSANNPQMAAALKKEVLDTITILKQTDDADKLTKLQTQIERLEDIGIDRIIPSEGIVFMYNGKPYKFTGAFAPVNQILGTLKFAKGKAQETEEPEGEKEKQEKPPTEPTGVTPEPTQPTEQRTVAIFTGRFQPFHAGHYSIYKALVTKFGKENVFIATSDKTDDVKSPFGFNDKQQIMKTMFDIPSDMIVKVKNPYAPTEILKDLPPETVYVTAVSEKDSDRLKGKYFKSYDDTPADQRKGYKDNGYVIIAPEMQLQINGKNISGTNVRELMGNPNITDRAKQEIFIKIYGKFDKKIFDKIVKTTTNSEEAKRLTDLHGKDVGKPRMKPKDGDAQPRQKKVDLEPEQDKRKEYRPGQTWTTANGFFAGKNKLGRIKYFTNSQSATLFARS